MVAAPILGKHAAEAGSVRRRHVTHGVLAVETAARGSRADRPLEPGGGRGRGVSMT